MGEHFLNQLRKAAEGKGKSHLPVKALLSLLEEGPSETVFRAQMRLGRRRAERQYVRARLNAAFAQPGTRMTDVAQDLIFSVIVPLYNTPEAFLREMAASVQEQTYPGWELCLADGSGADHPETERVCRELAKEDSRIKYRKLEHNGGISENTNACLEMAAGKYLALLDHDDLLTPDALETMAEAILRTGADFLYSDEMIFLSPDRFRVIGLHMKPDFAPDSLLANNYICHLSVFSAALLEKAGRFRREYDGSQDHDLILRLTDAANRVVHVPETLYLWRSHPASVAGDIESKQYAVNAGQRAVRDFLRAKGIEAKVSSSPLYPTLYQVEYPLRGTPTVSVIADGSGSDPKNQQWEQEVRRITAYPHLEWIWTRDAGQDEGRAERRNRAARNAKGDYLLFLLPGITPREPEWIEALLRHAQRESIGAVGGKILFGNGKVRQAGVILGLGKHGIAGRSHYLAEGDNTGYFGQLAIVEDMSAVGEECLMVQRKKFLEAGGFDPLFAEALAEPDLCLRLREAGYHNLYTPEAVLTGGRERDTLLDVGAEKPAYARETERFQTRWIKPLRMGDPFYNPNLTLKLPDYRVEPRRSAERERKQEGKTR